MDQQTYLATRDALMAAHSAERPEFQGRYLEWAFLSDDTATTGFDAHYVYHVAWAIRRLMRDRPEMHADFASSLHFCTAAAAFCETRFYDFRPAELVVEGLTCLQADLTDLNIEADAFDSVSCMHVLEHIGLGRYGDTPDAIGDLKAIAELKRIVRPGGRLYLVVPTGRPSVVFNAHRVYSAEAFISYFSDLFDLEEFYFIRGDSTAGAPLVNPPFAETLAYDYGCGCYALRRRPAT
jgi:SAM-dependent methyltransferase